MTVSNAPAHERAALVALRCGLPPHAEPLDCEDMRGPRSFFGESACLPKPTGPWTDRACCSHNGKSCSGAYEDYLALWRDEAGCSTLHLARAISDAAANAEAAFPSLAVPAPTFMVGRCTTTFAVAWSLWEDGMLPEWGTVIASCQKEGRGQMRRPWHSPRGNLYVTFRLPTDPLLQGDAASLVTGYIVVKAFQALGFSVSLKWPNDLLLDESGKAGGILLEEKNGVILAGMGVNLVEAPSASLLREHRATRAAVLLPDAAPVAADQPAGCVFAEEPLAPFGFWRRLVSEAILAYSRLVKGQTLSEIFTALSPHLAWKGRDVVLREGGDATLSGRFLGLGHGGGLRLQLKHGEICEVFSGSLSLAP